MSDLDFQKGQRYRVQERIGGMLFTAKILGVRDGYVWFKQEGWFFPTEEIESFQNFEQRHPVHIP